MKTIKQATMNTIIHMTKHLFVRTFLFLFAAGIFLHASSGHLFAQSPMRLTDFTVYAGPNGTGTSLIGSSITINNGAVGATRLVQTTGNATINASIHSGDKVILTNSNIVTGRITAANSSSSSGTILTVGSSTNIWGPIDVNGNIVIGGGTVSGTVTLPAGNTYIGPVPAGDTVFGTPSLPVLPSMPDERLFDPATSDIVTTSQVYTPTPGRYGNINYSGNKTLTLRGPGVYVFNSFAWTGNSNKLIFDFNGNTTDKFYIYVHGNADFGKLNASIIGGSADRIYFETHGSGIGTTIPGNSFIIANGSSGGGSKWNGTVYASRSGINIGSGTGSSTLTGAFYSVSAVTLQSGVTLNYFPFNFCVPVIAQAGVDQTGAATCGSTQVTLAANNPTPGTGVWSVVSGTGGSFGNTSNPASTFTGVAGNTYTLRWSISNGTCPLSTDDVIVKFNQNPSAAFAGADQTDAATCGLTTINLTATTPTIGTGAWSIISGTGGSFGNTSNAASSFSGTAGNTYNLRWTVSNNPCTASTDNVLVTLNQKPSNVNAGPDKVLEFTGTTKLKGNGSGTGYNWQAINGGRIITPVNQQEITVSSAGTYVFTVTNAIGCNNTDSVNVTSRLKKIIGSELQSLYENYSMDDFPGQDTVFFEFNRSIIPDTTDYVMIDIICKIDTQTVINLLTQPEYGLRNVIPNGLSKRTVTGEFPILNLPKLDLLDSILNFARPYYRPTTNNNQLISQGDTTIKTHFVRKGYDLDGSGIKIGVISDSYKTITNGTTATLPLQPITVPPNPVPQTFNTQTATQDVSNGDLPSNVSVLLDFPVRKTDEGRAMMQIIQDVAPGAKKYFYTGFYTAGYFAKAIEILKDSGCNIITDDVTYITEPMLKDGIVAKTVNKVRDQGVSYFTAAGNFANRSYEKSGNWVSAESLGFAPGKTAHNFRTDGTVDMFQKIKLRPGSYTLVFQWVDNIYSADEISGTQYDLDIYLTKEDDINGAGLIGYNRDNSFGDPIEFIPITIPPGGDSIYNVLIINHDTTGGPQRLKYVAFKGPIEFLEYNEGNSTIVGQGNADGAITVGAARFNHVPGHPLLPAALSGITKPQIETFSSLGGTYVTNSIGVQAQRLKPDLVAADGVNTTVRMGQDYPNEALDGWSNFFGTSAAAPHAAAAAALLMQGRKKFLAHHPVVTTPDTMKTLLQSTAVDMRPPGLIGYDFNSGAGLIDADSAMRTFAVPEPFQIKLVVPGDTLPGRSSFILKITGENFSNTSVVYLVDNNGDTTKLYPDSVTKTEIFVEIPPFEGNPKIMVYTPPITAFGDGGFSNILRFFLPEIVIKAVPVYLKYGQAIPQLDTVITIDDTLIQNSSHTLASIGLSSLQVTTNADDRSPVGTYNIDVSRPFDETNPVDSALLEKFRYSFIDTFLFISKTQVKVVPDDLTVRYGQPINNITYKYYDENNNLITDPQLLNQLDSSHRKYMADNALAVINGYPGSPALTANDLTNLSGMVTVEALKNARKFKTVAGSLVPVVAADSNLFDLQYIIDVSAESVRNYLNNPAQVDLEASYPGINSRAILGAQKILSGEAKVYLNGLVPIVNGELVPVVNSIANKFVPLVNRQLVQLVNGAPMELVDGGLVPIVNGDLVKIVNGIWVKEVNGELVPIVNGDLVQVVNGELMKLVNRSLVPVVNGELVQLVNNAGGLTLVQMVNGSLNQVVNTSLVPVVNGELVQIVNGELMKLVNASLVPVVNGELMKLVNGELMKLVNGELVHLVNGAEIPIANNLYDIQIINGNLVQLVNGTLYPLVNGLNPLVNGAFGLVPIVNSYSADGTSNTNAVVIIDSTDVAQQGVLGALFSTNIITGLNVGEQKLVSGSLFNTNFDVTYGLGTVTITADTITVKADSISRPFGNNNPPLTYTLIGFRLGETLATSGVTGNASLSTTAVSSSPLGDYPITITQGTLSAANYVFKFVNGILTVIDNPCLLTHSPFKNFGNTTTVPTSLWLNMTTKVSGQLNAHGDYLLFESGSITFNNISSTPIVTDLPIPKGRIEADMNTLTPTTHFDSLNNIWITKVPVGFSSTSDIFVTGAKINSSNGFVKQGGNTSSVLKGIFYSNKSFSDQWAYGIAAYQPQYYYAAISNPGDVVSINGNYRAGTPVPIIGFLVNGASGGGGNNYTGSGSSFENFTACTESGARMMQPAVTTTTVERNEAAKPLKEELSAPFVLINPNPANDRIRINFAASQTAVSKIEIVTMNGTRVYVSDLGICQAGIQYRKDINVNNLPGGLYLIRIWNGSQVTSKKIVITH